MKNWHYALIVFLGGCCYGVLSTVVKLAYAAGISSRDITGAQYFFGTAFLWGIFLLSKKELPPAKQVSVLLACGIPFGLTGIFYYQSLQTVEASLAIIFLFQFVWIGSFFDWLFNKKKPTGQQLLSILILIFGSLLATNGFTGQNVAFSWLGLMWGLLAALTFTIFIFVSSFVEKSLAPVLRSTLFATGGLLTVGFLFTPAFFTKPEILIEIAPYGVFLGLFGVVMPPLFFSLGLPRLGPSLGSILSAVELPVAVTLSWLILAEKVNLLQWCGIALILTGIIAANLNLWKKQKSG